MKRQGLCRQINQKAGTKGSPFPPPLKLVKEVKVQRALQRPEGLSTLAIGEMETQIAVVGEVDQARRMLIAASLHAVEDQKSVIHTTEKIVMEQTDAAEVVPIGIDIKGEIETLIEGDITDEVSDETEIWIDAGIAHAAVTEPVVMIMTVAIVDAGDHFSVFSVTNLCKAFYIFVQMSLFKCVYSEVYG